MPRNKGRVATLIGEIEARDADIRRFKRRDQTQMVQHCCGLQEAARQELAEIEGTTPLKITRAVAIR
jgi:hypothetical protein